MQWETDSSPHLHLLRSLTIFTPGITRLQDIDNLTISDRAWDVADGLESASTAGLGWGRCSVCAVEREMARLKLEGSLERGPFALWYCFEVDPNNGVGAGGFGGSELTELVVLDSICRNFASIIAILLSVLIIESEPASLLTENRPYPSGRVWIPLFIILKVVGRASIFLNFPACRIPPACSNGAWWAKVTTSLRPRNSFPLILSNAVLASWCTSIVSQIANVWEGQPNSRHMRNNVSSQPQYSNESKTSGIVS